MCRYDSDMFGEVEEVRKIRVKFLIFDSWFDVNHGVPRM